MISTNHGQHLEPVFILGLKDAKEWVMYMRN